MKSMERPRHSSFTKKYVLLLAVVARSSVWYRGLPVVLQADFGLDARPCTGELTQLSQVLESKECN